MNNALNEKPLMRALDLNRRQPVVRYGQPDASPAIAGTHYMGVEIEVENCARFRVDNAFTDYWDTHNDGSLVDGIEFVMNPPRAGAELSTAIDRFFAAGLRYTGGERTSVHIHVDMTDDLKVGQMRSIFSLVYILEGAVYRAADEHRKWAGYSSPLIDMEYKRMNGILASTNADVLSMAISGDTHEARYFGLNCTSIKKHGTLEFRYFPCTDDKRVLLDWVNMVQEFKIAGMKFVNPLEMLGQIKTQEDVTAWVRVNMPRSAEMLLLHINVQDVIDRRNMLAAIFSDKNSGVVRKPAPKVSKSLKRLAVARGWAREDNGVAVQEEVPLPPPVRVEDLYLPDGQVDAAAYAALINNIRLRAARVGR